MNRTKEADEPVTLAALREEIDAQQARLTALRAEIGRLREAEPSTAQPAAAAPAPIGRRALFGKAAAVLAAGAGMAVVGVRPAFRGHRRRCGARRQQRRGDGGDADRSYS